MKNKSNNVRDHEVDPALAWLDVSTDAFPGVEALVDRHMLPQLLAPPFGRWAVRKKGHGGPNSSFYVSCNARVGDRLKGVQLHRVVAGVNSKEHVSHLNHNTLDNRLANLECTTLRLNIRHGRRGEPARGCYWNKAKRRWKSQVMVAGRYIHLGYFTDENDAHHAYTRANAFIDGAVASGAELSEQVFREAMGL